MCPLSSFLTVCLYLFSIPNIYKRRIEIQKKNERAIILQPKNAGFLLRLQGLISLWAVFHLLDGLRNNLKIFIDVTKNISHVGTYSSITIAAQLLYWVSLLGTLSLKNIANGRQGSRGDLNHSMQNKQRSTLDVSFFSFQVSLKKERGETKKKIKCAGKKASSLFGLWREKKAFWKM